MRLQELRIIELFLKFAGPLGLCCGNLPAICNATIGARDCHAQSRSQVGPESELVVGACPGAGSCCQPHAGPGCSDFDCCDAVCFVDSFCCEEEWDADCASFAALFCPSLCQPQVDCGQGDCCSLNATGCSDANCCELVCLADSSCCTIGWAASCSQLAREFCETCRPAFDCPQAGECCQAHLGGGCDRSGCCQTVCQMDPTCCTDNWGFSCASIARENCLNVCECAAFGDFDANARVDLRDAAAMQRCFSGDGSPVPASPCSCADYDADGDADLVDHAHFIQVLSGP